MHQRSYILYLLFFISMFAACQSSKETTVKKIVAEKQLIRLPDSLSQKQAAGIDFFANGDQPVGWTVEMDADKGYYFKTSNGIFFEIPPVKPVRDPQLASNIYAYSSRQGEMSIQVFDAPCANNTEKKVEITVNGTRYSGCGKDLYNNAINDVWILEKDGITVLDPKDFPRGLPRLAFTIAESKITGTDGCADISAPIQMMGSRVKFGAVTAGSGSCKNTRIRKVFIEKISNQVADYYFKNGRLYLYLVDDSILEFRKA